MKKKVVWLLVTVCMKVLIIPDKSTQQAALRTGKIDRLLNIEVADTEPLIKSNPELERIKVISANQPTLFMRVDKPALPFYDVRVRQALAMAINHFEMRNVYYDGEAELLLWPLYPVPEREGAYVPFEELPKSTQELFEYHPDKARQLLAEAGYPNGFKTEALVASAPVRNTEILQILREYWAKIGVDLKIDVRESTVVTTMTRTKAFTQMYMGGILPDSPPLSIYTRKGSQPNYSMVDDPIVEAFSPKQAATYFDWETQRPMFREIYPYLYEQAWFMLLPAPYEYILWQPWLKGYYGANYASMLHSFAWPKYVWIDQELKKAMGY